MRIFEAVVAEFSPATASPMQMPWDFHVKCARSLQVNPKKDASGGFE